MSEQNKNQYFWNFAFSVFYLLLVAAAIYILRWQNKLAIRISIFDFTLLILATFRLTHLFVYDSVMDFLRDYFEKFSKGPGATIFHLLSCPWCTGIWIALLVSFIYFLTPLAWFAIFIIALAGAAIILKIVADKILRS